MVTPHSDDDGAKFSFFLDSLIINKGYTSSTTKPQVIHKVLWMPAREDMIGLKEAEGKWEFLSRKLMGTE
jgi:hypothetical protein